MGYRYTLILRLPKLVTIDGNEITPEEREKALVFKYLINNNNNNNNNLIIIKIYIYIN